MPKLRHKVIASSQSAIWQVRTLRSDYEWEGKLVAYWEIEYDPISDNYTQEEISAEELFDLWVNKVIDEKYPNNMIPIYWFVACEEERKFEWMPFQHIISELGQNFLSFYTWPINKETGEKLDWFNLPVVDKYWNRKRTSKGGFIQEFTGWKPGILQPCVYLPSLLQGRDSQ